MNDFQELINFKKDTAFVCGGANAKAAFIPDLGARVFCELNGSSLHRLDIENVRKPDKPFNNYGGNNFWPAPEGGGVGFNYDGDAWRVQTAINNEPFLMKSGSKDSAVAEKKTILKNRKGTAIEVRMQRTFAVDNVADVLARKNPRHYFAYTVEDSMEVLNKVKIQDALLACWTLEQFDASDSTFGFVKVKNPQKAINFDFYEDPREKITYKPSGFIYKTDGRKAGQIGIKTDAKADFAGFYDLSKNLICIREIVEESKGTYFNIADNAQPNGPFSASDNYSIFNGGKEQGFFEIETIGAAIVDGDFLKGSKLKSRTSFAVFGNAAELESVIREILE
ncbi:MAG TPA: hypothetical protein DDW84_07765 [Phycisphaerales bacterium]|nr:MAG: hypothetical protein A2Y13_07215 [Planctomycetes bacterium GWC2_45_44]HBG78718.1 hypothetical protein [Phycisphaerales bacterium]HBR20011.1 hypothetical protein [Phycisphaerales bacterium]